jgi:hypothetical protein
MSRFYFAAIMSQAAIQTPRPATSDSTWFAGGTGTDQDRQTAWIAKRIQPGIRPLNHRPN